MPYLRCLPDESSLLAALARRPGAARALLDYHEEVLRGPSEITPGEREFLAALVSAANACAYCHGVHEEAARAFGIPDGAVPAALRDPVTAPLDARMAALATFTIKLAREPGRMTARDAHAVLEAGWSESALLDAVAVCGLFSLMNRLVQGLGIDAGESYRAMAGRRLREGGYAALKDLVGSGAPAKADAPDRSDAS